MAQVPVDILQDRDKSDRIAALSASPVEKVRGLSAFVVPILHAGELEAQVRALSENGTLEGRWPFHRQEHAAQRSGDLPPGRHAQ